MSKTKEEQQKRVLEYQFFNLSKFKVTKEGVDITHYESGDTGGEVTKKGNAQPHPDLINKLKSLNHYMASLLGLLEGWDFSREHVKKDVQLLTKAKAGHDLAVQRCEVQGVIFIGEGEKAGVKFTGAMRTPTGGSVGMSTPKITFESDDWGYEEDVVKICEELKEEIYLYRFKNKKAQLDLMDEAEKAEEENKD